MRKKVKGRKTSFKQIKTRKAGSSWFKLVYFDIFADLFPIFNELLLPLRPNISLSIPQIT